MRRIPGGSEFDTWLRQMAPAPPEVSPADRDALWRALHARGRPPRRARVKLALPGLAAVLLLVALNPMDVGSDAMRPVAVHQDQLLGTAYESWTGSITARLQQYEGAERERAYDAMLEADLTRSAPFKDVTGFRIRGQQTWTIGYLPERDGTVYRVGMPPVFPANDRAPEAMDFLQKHGAELIRKAREGAARDAGVTYAFVDGRPVALRRWTETFPDYGAVTYYQGNPLP